jgi:Terminase small subunit
MPRLDNTRQERFAEAYASGNNGTQSCRLAGYAAKPAAAAVHACRLLRNPKVRARVVELRKGADCHSACKFDPLSAGIGVQF